MILHQGRFWRACLARGSVDLEILKTSIPEELYEVRDLRFDVPLERWNRLVKHVHSDRKLLGGLLLDFARSKERVSTLIGSDRMLAELRSVVLAATATLVEEEVLVLKVVERGGKAE